MKTSWGKPVQNVGSIRALLVTLSVGVCIATLMGCDNKPEKDTSPVADPIETPAADPIETLRKAAEQGDADAQYDFGVLHANGKGGVPKDHAEALKWFRKAAEQGHAEAQYGLVMSYAFGFGVPKDNAEAIKWCRKAAEQGHAEAQVYLGRIYDKGDGVPEDAAEAAKWFRKSAEQGDSYGQFRLGTMYANGAGVPEDNAQAFVWFSVAAASGLTTASENRDSIKGELTPTQLEKGQARATEILEQVQKLYRKAAEQGHAEAQYKLGNCYFRGIGVADDDVAAYAWHSVAAASGYEKARNMLDVTSHMLTASELEKGAAMAREISERIEKRKTE